MDHHRDGLCRLASAAEEVSESQEWTHRRPPNGKYQLGILISFRFRRFGQVSQRSRRIGIKRSIISRAV